MREAKLSHMASGNNALDILNMACSCATVKPSTLTLNIVGAAGGLWLNQSLRLQTREMVVTHWAEEAECDDHELRNVPVKRHFTNLCSSLSPPIRRKQEGAELEEVTVSGVATPLWVHFCACLSAKLCSAELHPVRTPRQGVWKCKPPGILKSLFW